jgi:hypothetical protein
MLHFVAEVHVNGGCFENLLILTNDVTQNNKISSILFSRKMSQNGFRNREIFVTGLAVHILKTTINTHNVVSHDISSIPGGNRAW